MANLTPDTVPPLLALLFAQNAIEDFSDYEIIFDHLGGALEYGGSIALVLEQYREAIGEDAAEKAQETAADLLVELLNDLVRDALLVAGLVDDDGKVLA